MSEDNHSSVQPKSTLMKDLAVPLAIIIAGAFIGLGLYFSGGSTTGLSQNGTLSEQDASKQANPLLSLVTAAGVNEKEFTQCFEAGEKLAEVQSDANDAVETGGRGTPWGVVVGPTGKKYPLNGAIPQSAIEQLIDVAMNDTTPSEETAEALALEKMDPVTEEDHIKGSINAKVMIVEYSDYDCPFCSRFHDTMNNIVEKYAAEDVAWVYRHFPLEQLHPNASAIAVASECVADLGGNDAFWKFTDGYLAK